MARPDPKHIMQIASGFGVSRALLAAVGLDLYTRLAQGEMTHAQIVREFNLKSRPALDVLDLLVSVNLLARQGNGPDSRYSNTPETATFLDRESPDYLGGILELWHSRNYGFWTDLPEALKTGTAQSETKGDGASFFQTLYEEPARLEGFMAAMNAASRQNFETFARVFPFDRVKTLTDIGGADALLSRLVVAAHPHMTCTSLDLPVVTEIAQRKVVEAGVGDRIHLVAGDFFEATLPSADVVVMGMILHDWNLDKKKMLIKKAYDALSEGGAFVAIEALIDDARRKNTFGMFMSLNMLIEFGDAFDFTGAEFKDWCEEAGFRHFEMMPLLGPSTAAIAYK
ncbi:MAG: methyltransferase [Hyphomicrobiaceae bacterium]